MDGQLWHCSDCGDEREFEQPICIDGHTEDGGLCPEWACVDCGAALVSGIALGLAPAGGAPRLRHVA